MNITGARTHILQATLSQPLASSRAWYDNRTAMLVEIADGPGYRRLARMLRASSDNRSGGRERCALAYRAGSTAYRLSMADDLCRLARSWTEGCRYPRLKAALISPYGISRASISGFLCDSCSATPVVRSSLLMRLACSGEKWRIRTGLSLGRRPAMSLKDSPR